MLQHQIDFSKAMTEIYKPISGRMSDPETLKVQGNVEGIRACEEYEAVVKELQETLAPELEMIDSRVIRPATELMDIIKVIRKTATKREHKKLDYDRHRATLKKLQEKKDKSAKDEKAMWKAENDVEQSTQEFNYFNDMLKEELPKLFALEREFIQPLFQSFYYMQLNIFYTLHERMQRVDIGYFDLTIDLLEAFEKKRGDIQQQAESLSIVKFKTSGQKRPPKYGGPRPAAIEGPSKPVGLLEAPGSQTPSSIRSPSLSSTPPPAAAATANAPTKPPALGPTWKSRQQQPQSETDNNPPPPYSPSAPISPSLRSPSAGSASASASAAALAAAAKSKPPPPKPKPKGLSVAAANKTETVTALYDYAAQAEGDLSFRAGDTIEIVSRTANSNEWWVGRLAGKQGQFPGRFFLVCFPFTSSRKWRDRDR
jgi:amphiphysin